MRFLMRQVMAVGMAALLVGLVLGVAIGRSLQPFGISSVFTFQDTAFHLVNDEPIVTPVSVIDLEADLITGMPVMIMDVRGKEEFAAAHIPDSSSVPLEAIGSRSIEIPRQQAIVVYSYGDKRGQQAARLLFDLGFTNVRYLEGGILAWQQAGLEMIR